MCILTLEESFLLKRGSLTLIGARAQPRAAAKRSEAGVGALVHGQHSLPLPQVCAWSSQPVSVNLVLGFPFICLGPRLACPPSNALKDALCDLVGIRSEDGKMKVYTWFDNARRRFWNSTTRSLTPAGRKSFAKYPPANINTPRLDPAVVRAIESKKGSSSSASSRPRASNTGGGSSSTVNSSGQQSQLASRKERSEKRNGSKRQQAAAAGSISTTGNAITSARAAAPAAQTDESMVATAAAAAAAATIQQ